MKKILLFITVLAVTLCSVNMVYAADEYSFDLQYQGTIVKNVEKDATVLLTGVNGTPHVKVQIKVNITGPSTPKIIATDSAGNKIDIAQTGIWGPPEGFAIGGSFVNNTPVKATFMEEGEYIITLSLIDLSNSNAVITSKSFTIEVFEDEAPIVNNVITGNVIEELPKTGNSILDYVIYTTILVCILTAATIMIKRRRINQ